MTVKFTPTEQKAIAAFIIDAAPKYLEDVIGALLKSPACIELRRAHGQEGIDKAVVALSNKIETLGAECAKH